MRVFVVVESHIESDEKAHSEVLAVFARAIDANGFLDRFKSIAGYYATVEIQEVDFIERK